MLIPSYVGAGVVGTAMSTSANSIDQANIKLEKIYQAFSGGDNSVNIHKDFSGVASAVNNKSKVVTKSLEMSSKTKQFYNEAKVDAVKSQLESETTVQGDCQSALATDAVKNISVKTNVSLKANTASMNKLTETRRKTMRNQSLDKSMAIASYAERFCSAKDAAVGLCNEEDICQEGDPSCKANANQSAELFLADGYDNMAHQEGAMMYMMNIVDPYPEMKPTKEELLDENKDLDTYRYDTMVEESRRSASLDLLKFLWQERSNIYVSDPNQDINKYLSNISDSDSQTKVAADYYINRPFKPSGYKTVSESMAEENTAYTEASQSLDTGEHPLTGNISSLELLEMQVNTFYGNTAFDVSLIAGEEERAKSLERVAALNNVLKLKLLKRIDMLVFAQGAELALKKE